MQTVVHTPCKKYKYINALTVQSCKPHSVVLCVCALQPFPDYYADVSEKKGRLGPYNISKMQTCRAKRISDWCRSLFMTLVGVRRCWGWTAISGIVVSGN